LRYISVSLAILLATAGFADTLVLRNGRTVNGTVITLGGTPREIRIDVGGKTQSFSVSDVSSVSFALPAEPEAQNSYPPEFGFLIGEWESQSPGNLWHMRISWDSANKQFRGILTVQGEGSEAVGFQIGELVWTAEPTSQRALAERQKWRYGPLNYEWRMGRIDLGQSSGDRWVSSANACTFLRVR